MPQVGGRGETKYFPADKDIVKLTQIYNLLDRGFEVVVNRDGKIIDVWDPVSKQLYTDKGHTTEWNPTYPGYWEILPKRQTGYAVTPKAKSPKELTGDAVQQENQDLETEIKMEEDAIRLRRYIAYVKYRRLRALKKEQAYRDGEWTPRKLFGRRTGGSVGCYMHRWT